MTRLAVVVTAMLLLLPPGDRIAGADARAPDDAARSHAVLQWDTHDQFDQCYRNRYLDSEGEPGAVKLVRRLVVTDEMGAGYNDFQRIGGKTQAKKILVLDSADVTDATLLIGGGVGGCDIVVNGQVLGTKPLARSYWHSDFDRYTVPPKLLKDGANEFVFRAKSGGGSIRIERSQQPNRSAVSRDGGYLWDHDRLADGGYMNGELQVRLNIGRYAPEAWLHSPVIDLAGTVTIGGVPAGAQVQIDALELDADVPAGTTVAMFVRTGATPDGYEENWTRWHAWPKEKDSLTFHRYAQWRLVMTTAKAQTTPVVRRVTARVSSTAAPDVGTKLKLTDDDNQQIIRSSYTYAYSPYNGKLRNLRDHFKLADVIAHADTEVEKLKALRQWVRNQWTSGWGTGTLNYVPSWDARVILTMASQKLSLGMCTHYAATYVQCSQAMGYTSRTVIRGHCLSETWSNQYRKWVIMDAGADPDDRRRSTYTAMRDGIPLNEMDLHKAYYVDKKWDDITVEATNMSLGDQEPSAPFNDPPEALLKQAHQQFIPLRNNFIDHREPQEPEHGMGYFKFLGDLFWKDATTPDVPWTDFFTTREADMYWSLNQAQVHLQVLSPAGDELQVMLDTVTPNFAGYEYRVDGGEWVTWVNPSDGKPQAPGEVRAYPMSVTGGAIALPWRLHDGRNTFEARPFNLAELRGIVSRVVVDAVTP